MVGCWANVAHCWAQLAAVLRAPAGSSSSMCVFSKPLAYALAACVYALLYCCHLGVPHHVRTATAVLSKSALHPYMSVHGVVVHAVSDCALLAVFVSIMQCSSIHRGATKLGACCGLRQHAYSEVV